MDMVFNYFLYLFFKFTNLYKKKCTLSLDLVKTITAD